MAENTGPRRATSSSISGGGFAYDRVQAAGYYPPVRNAVRVQTRNAEAMTTQITTCTAGKMTLQEAGRVIELSGWNIILKLFPVIRSMKTKA
jgi:hypothetical protein